MKPKDSLYKLAVLDNSLSWLLCVKDIYAKESVSLYTYMFGEEGINKLLQRISVFDVILVDASIYLSKGKNKNTKLLEDLLAKVDKKRLYLIGDTLPNRCKLSSRCLLKKELQANPMCVFKKKEAVSTLRTLTVKLQTPEKRTDVRLEDPTEIWWAIPFRVLLDDPNCTLIQLKARKGDLQPEFYVAQKAILMVVKGSLDFGVNSQEGSKKYSLGMGDMTEIPAGAIYEQICYTEDVEFLFITIPYGKGIPKVSS